MHRSHLDSRLVITRALPAQNTNVNSTSLNLGTPLPDHEVRIAIPATPSLASGQTITCTLQDSADGSSFAAIAELATLVVTGGGGGGAATTRDVKLPASFRGHLRVNIAASATAGDNTAVSATVSVLT